MPVLSHATEQPATLLEAAVIVGRVDTNTVKTVVTEVESSGYVGELLSRDELVGSDVLNTGKFDLLLVLGARVGQTSHPWIYFSGI